MRVKKRMKSTFTAVQRVLLSVIALLAVPSSDAQSVDRGAYVVAGVSQVDIDDGIINDEDSGFFACGGYRFNTYVGLEGQWIDGSHIETIVGEIRFRSIDAYALGYALVSSRFALVGKAGWQAWDIGRRNSIVGDDGGTDFSYGFGAQYLVNEDFGQRAEWQRVEFADIEVDAHLISVNYCF